MWICKNCGKQNADGFEICMYCGSLAEEAAQSVQPQKPVQPRQPGLKSEPRKPTQPNKKALIARIAVVAAVLVLVFGLSFSAHGKAKAALENGDYAQAMKSAEADFLFGKELLQEAQVALSREYISQGEYEDAFELIKEIKDAVLRYDMFAELGEAQLEAGLYEDAHITYLGIGEDPRGVEGRNKALLGQARDATFQRDYARAEELLEEMDDEQFESLNGEEVYRLIAFNKGKDCLFAKDYTGAVENLEGAVGFGNAADTLEAARCLAEGRAYDAALFAVSGIGDAVEENSDAGLSLYDDVPVDDDGQISREEWEHIFWEECKARWHSDSVSRMDSEAAYKLFCADRELPVESDARDMYTYLDLDGIPSGLSVAMSESSTTQLDKDALSSAGSAPEGKILIVWQLKNYHSKEKEYGIAWNLMKYLPEEYYPHDLGSVEYVVRVAYDYQGDGYYSLDGESVAAIRQYAKIYAEKAGFGKQVYSSSTVWGSEAPNVIYTNQIRWGDSGGYVPGSNPEAIEAAEAVIEAINAAAEKIG